MIGWSLPPSHDVKWWRDLWEIGEQLATTFYGRPNVPIIVFARSHVMLSSSLLAHLWPQGSFLPVLLRPENLEIESKRSNLDISQLTGVFSHTYEYSAARI